MDFYEVLDQVVDLLKQRGRASYRALKLQFQLDDETLEALQEEILYSQPLVVGDEGRGLIWIGDTDTATDTLATPSITAPTSLPPMEPEREPVSYTPPHLAEKILQSKSALEGERKHVSVLFCDLANSTPLAEQIGPENMHALLNGFFELALNEVHRYEGTINQFLGDGFMAIMGAPIAHEDHARRAVLSALGLQQQLKETALGEPYGVACQFRIGINSGLVVVGSIGDNLRMDYSAIGDTTNLAARLQTQAEPGEILVSEATARLVEGYIRLDALEAIAVKGKTEPVSILKVLGTLPRRSPIVSRSERTLSQFVGRDRELATLEELFGQVASGNGQVVGIVAEAGAGKSRLLYEFRQRLQDTPVTYLEGRCLSYGSASPYHPILDVLRHNCGITDTDSPETITEKVQLSLQEVGLDAEESAPYLLQVLGLKDGTEPIAMLTPEAVRTRTFETLRQMSLNGAQRRPLIFEVEDLHWVDKTSEDYMATLVESLAGVPILLLTTYRPGYQPSWLGKSYATQISLHNLPSQDALTIVHSTCPDGVLTDNLAQTIIAKAEGNPFFLEELTRTVAASDESTAELAVPDTVQGVLSARIDRLPESSKRLLQTASVLGREFSSTLLHAIWDTEDELGLILQALKRQEFLFERTGDDEPLYVFKHALTQDVAYESLLSTRRENLHRTTARALERLYTERLEEVRYDLAYHYLKANESAKAVASLEVLIDKAMQGFAYAEAVMMSEQGLVQAEQLTEKREHKVMELAIRQAESLFWLGRRQESIDVLLGYQDRLERLENALLAGQYYQWLGYIYAFQGERQLAQQSLHQALTEGSASQNAVIMGRAHMALAAEFRFAGDLAQCLQYAQEAVRLLEDTTEPYWLGTALYVLGLSYAGTDRLHEAIEVSTRLHQMGESTGDRRLRTNALMTMGMAYFELGEVEASLETLQHALAVSPDAFESAAVLGILGRTQLPLGDVSRAITTLEKAVEQANRYRSRQVQSLFRSFLGEAYSQSHQFQQAYDIALQGLQLAEDIKYPEGIQCARHTLGRIANASGNLVEAETYFQSVLETMREGVSSRQAQLYLDFAMLAQNRGDWEAVTTHLSTAYAWFKKLQIPKWMERTEQLAREYGVTLTEVELEDFETEGSS